MKPVDYYLIAVNVIGFIVTASRVKCGGHTGGNTVFEIIALLGGSAGVLLGLLLFERKPAKGSIMSRVFITCIFVIQALIVLASRGYISGELSYDFGGFFAARKGLVYYLIAVSIITFAAFGIDKRRAEEHRGRIPIATLLGLAFIGGSVGALLGMYVFSHKTKKDYFVIGVPIIILVQTAALIFAMNAKPL